MANCPLTALQAKFNRVVSFSTNGVSMTDYVIACDAFVRLTSLIADDVDPIFQTVRFDNGQAVATDRQFMSIENIGGAAGIVHIAADSRLIAQCVTEAQFHSKLTITVTEPLKFAVAKTTLGYIHPDNCSVWPDGPTDFDRWRDVVMASATPAEKSNGGMFWRASSVAKLAKASPSGRIVFEETIDTIRPTLVRDVLDYDWLGVFNPFSAEDFYSPATLPTWMTAR